METRTADFYIDKQPSKVYFKKSCSKKFCKVLRKTHVPVSGLQVCNLMKKRFQKMCLCVNFLKFIRTSF